MIIYNFDKEEYMYKLSQIFALQVAQMYQGRMCLWLDTENVQTKLCHAYAKLLDNIYVDAYGVFCDISQRENNFKYNTRKIVECTIENAKGILDELKVGYKEVELKRNAREFLRNNMLSFEMNIREKNRIVGLYNIDRKNKRVTIMTYEEEAGKFGDYISIVSEKEFRGSLVNFCGFIANPKWYYKK